MELETSPIKQSVKLKDIILRPQINFVNILKNVEGLELMIDSFEESRTEVVESAEIELKYSGYIEREKIIADKIKRLEGVKINSDFDFKSLKSLSTEARQKLTRIRPLSIGQAARISGISPSDINILLVQLGR